MSLAAHLAPTDAPLRRRLVFDLHTRIPQQAELWTAPEPYILYLGGRGCGKTKGGALWALSRAAGSTGLIVAPTHNNLLSGALAVLLPQAYEWGLVRSHNSQTGELRLIDGKLFYLRSLDRPELIKGMTVGWFWSDEMNTIAEKKAWDIIIGCVRGPGIHQRLVTANPPWTGTRHWLHEVFVERGVPGRHRIIVGRTSDNPYNGPDYETELRHEYSEAAAASQLDGQWIDVGAVQVYNMPNLNSAPLPSPELARTARGWDIAATAGGGDYTAGMLISTDKPKGGHFYIRDVVRGQWASGERNRIMRETAEGDETAEATRKIIVSIGFPQERGGSGKSVVDHWITDTFAGYHASAYPESGDKVMRADILATQIEYKNVTLTAEPGRWENYWHDGRRLSPEAARARFRRNMENFPIGRTKDESDAGWFAMMALKKGAASPVHL